MRMEASGLLLEFWRGKKRAAPSMRRCLDKAREMTQVPVKPRLSLIHLSGAFVVLAAGLFMSFMAFFGEVFYCYCWTR